MTLESWGGSIGTSEDIEVQPCVAHHEHKISHVFSVGILCLPYNICLFFPKVVVPLNLFLNLKKNFFLKHKNCKYSTKKLLSWHVQKQIISGSVVKNPPADAGDTGLIPDPSGKESPCRCRRHRFDPWPGKIPHAAEQLCLCAYWAHVP